MSAASGRIRTRLGAYTWSQPVIQSSNFRFGFPESGSLPANTMTKRCRSEASCWALDLAIFSCGGLKGLLFGLWHSVWHPPPPCPTGPPAGQMEMYGNVKSGILIDFDPFDGIGVASNQPPTHSHAEISRLLGLRLAKEKDMWPRIQFKII